MNLDTEFISAMCAWCREHEIVWEYSSLTMTHYFIKMPSDPIERSLQECFGKSFPACCVSHHLMMDFFDSIIRPWCEENGINIVKGKDAVGIFYTFSVYSGLDTESGVSEAIDELFDTSFKKKKVSLSKEFCHSMEESLAKTLTEYLSTNLLGSRTDP